VNGERHLFRTWKNTRWKEYPSNCLYRKMQENESWICSNNMMSFSKFHFVITVLIWRFLIFKKKRERGRQNKRKRRTKEEKEEEEEEKFSLGVYIFSLDFPSKQGRRRRKRRKKRRKRRKKRRKRRWRRRKRRKF